MAEDIPKEEKTEEATPRRRTESRERGHVAFSSEIGAAGVLAAATLALVFGGGAVGSRSGRVTVDVLSIAGSLGPSELSIADVARLAEVTARTVLPGLLALILPMLACAVLTSYGQAGFQIAPRAVALDLAKIDPLKGITRLFSLRSLVRLASSSGKLVFIVGAMLLAVLGDVPRLGALAGAELRPSLAALASILVKSAAAAVFAVIVIALADLFWQRRTHSRELRMTKKEVFEEMKESEGDPHVRSRIRQIQRELARRRMMADVPKASVVVTNPTHYAVALQYDREGAARTGEAPRIVAKGADHVALAIRRVAEEAGVPVHENPPLARALHAQTEIGDEIPEELFQAVAGVLAYVYRLHGERVSA